MVWHVVHMPRRVSVWGLALAAGQRASRDIAWRTPRFLLGSPPALPPSSVVFSVVSFLCGIHAPYGREAPPV